jgi:L-serine dehydratase
MTQLPARSVLDIYRIGIGPSSSHTVGPMRAAADMRARVLAREDCERVEVELFGSLALTGLGHATDRAVCFGLLGFDPETVDVDHAEALLQALREEGTLDIGGRRILFLPSRDIRFNPNSRGHPNTLALRALHGDGRWTERVYRSVGGGRIECEGEAPESGDGGAAALPYASARDALEQARRHGLSLAQLVRRNETAWRSDAQIDGWLDRVWDEMNACIERGLACEGELPGGLGLARRARSLLKSVSARERTVGTHPSDRAAAYAMAVNEENAAGRRIVTAPTNGAAGVLPAVLRHYVETARPASREGIRDFLLTAALFGDLVRRNASISGAEVGCQGEVGTACAMAAAGLAAALGGSDAQIENAAEIGMEHHLGMSCDPVGGLVQVPCIERNAMGAVKAIHACTLALCSEDGGVVGFDEAVAAMRDTGRDMDARYKETALGGLAAKVVRWHRSA